MIFVFRVRCLTQTMRFVSILSLCIALSLPVQMTQQPKYLDYLVVSKQNLLRATCNNNGMLDSFHGSCACFDCWEGAQCEFQVHPTECKAASAGRGGTSYTEDYWLSKPDLLLQVPLAFHISYYLQDSPRLEKAIRRLHELVGNAVVRDKHIVFGVGSYELLVAAAHAFAAKGSSSKPSRVFAARPTWNIPEWSLSYPNDGQFLWNTCFPGFVNNELMFNVSKSSCAAQARDHFLPDIEIVTSPNNPDSHSNVKSTAAPNTIYDHAYYWPQFVGAKPVDYDDSSIATFSLSKCTGHASTRFGWAITSNVDLAYRMRMYTVSRRLFPPIDSQLKAAMVIEHVVSTQGEMIHHARALMQRRWKKLDELFSTSSCDKWHAEERDEATSDVFSGADGYEPTPPHLWLERLDGTDAVLMLSKANIGGHSGTNYGADARFARILLMQRERDYAVLEGKLGLMLKACK